MTEIEESITGNDAAYFLELSTSVTAFVYDTRLYTSMTSLARSVNVILVIK